MPRGDHKKGDVELVAFVKPHAGFTDERVLAGALKSGELALASYMLPQRTYVVRDWPTSPHTASNHSIRIPLVFETG